MKMNKAFNPIDISTFSANAVMLHPQLVAYLIKQVGWRFDHRGVLSRNLQNTIKIYLVFSIR